MLMIGYSSYAVIIIRSTQNTPMDQNSPEDIFSLRTYLGREQYGDTPLLYGPAFSSSPCFEKVGVNEETGQLGYRVMTDTEAYVQRRKTPVSPTATTSWKTSMASSILQP